MMMILTFRSASSRFFSKASSLSFFIWWIVLIGIESLHDMIFRFLASTSTKLKSKENINVFLLLILLSNLKMRTRKQKSNLFWKVTQLLLFGQDGDYANFFMLWNIWVKYKISNYVCYKKGLECRYADLCHPNFSSSVDTFQFQCLHKTK